MELVFPDRFMWGYSTSSYQIETASEHDLKNLPAMDGSVLNRTTDHEKRRKEDAKIIRGANAYRFSMDWARLQRGPNEPLDEKVVEEYAEFMDELDGLQLMLVLQHHANPKWFADAGGWANKHTKDLYLDFVKKVVDKFGDKIQYWNTFNEPQAYAAFAHLDARFPPFEKSLLRTLKAVNNMGKSHTEAYEIIKERMPESQVGYSKFTTVRDPQSKFAEGVGWLLDQMEYGWGMKQFKGMDFIGFSSYGKMPLEARPFPKVITEVDYPERLEEMGREHDDMFEYYPEGMGEFAHRLFEQYGRELPLIVTEHGVATTDDAFRVESMKAHFKVMHEAIQDGVPIQGYFYWAPWDNFETFVGTSKEFGTHSVDSNTMDRVAKPSAEFYSQVAKTNTVNVN